jgi:hypothetical protein
LYASFDNVHFKKSGWLLATCGWLTARASKMIVFQNISIYFSLLLATGGWLTSRAAMMIVFQFISFCFWQLATGGWQLANCKCFEDDRISINFILQLAAVKLHMLQ